MSLCAGAEAVWVRVFSLLWESFFFNLFESELYRAVSAKVGTRFVATVEAGAPKRHKQSVVTATHQDTMKTVIYTGRPMHVRRNWYGGRWRRSKGQAMLHLVACILCKCECLQWSFYGACL